MGYRYKVSGIFVLIGFTLLLFNNCGQGFETETFEVELSSDTEVSEAQVNLSQVDSSPPIPENNVLTDTVSPEIESEPESTDPPPANETDPESPAKFVDLIFEKNGMGRIVFDKAPKNPLSFDLEIKISGYSENYVRIVLKSNQSTYSVNRKIDIPRSETNIFEVDASDLLGPFFEHENYTPGSVTAEIKLQNQDSEELKKTNLIYTGSPAAVKHAEHSINSIPVLLNSGEVFFNAKGATSASIRVNKMVITKGIIESTLRGKKPIHISQSGNNRSFTFATEDAVYIIDATKDLPPKKLNYSLSQGAIRKLFGTYSYQFILNEKNELWVVRANTAINGQGNFIKIADNVKEFAASYSLQYNTFAYISTDNILYFNKGRGFSEFVKTDYENVKKLTGSHGGVFIETYDGKIFGFSNPSSTPGSFKFFNTFEISNAFQPGEILYLSPLTVGRFYVVTANSVYYFQRDELKEKSTNGHPTLGVPLFLFNKLGIYPKENVYDDRYRFK